MNLTHNPSPEALLIESRITLIEFKAALNSLNDYKIKSAIYKPVNKFIQQHPKQPHPSAI